MPETLHIIPSSPVLALNCQPSLAAANIESVSFPPSSVINVHLRSYIHNIHTMASPTQGRIRPGVSGVTETMLITLAARAADAASPAPLLSDRWAKDVMRHVDYQPRMNANFLRIVTLRARLLDTWTTEFLAANLDATVLQLACGLDSRALRLSPAGACGGSTSTSPRWWRSASAY